MSGSAVADSSSVTSLRTTAVALASEALERHTGFPHTDMCYLGLQAPSQKAEYRAWACFISIS